MPLSPIRIVEFAAALVRCLPQRAKPIIAVANSAGPDSTCLLFLLRQLFPPHALLSIHVVHHLQSTADKMAHTAAENARELGVPHHVAHITWDVPPFPPVPTNGPLERVARDARYHLLFNAITRANASFLALGHHADDQLETAILRLACGSSLLGASGMRPVRRWGMGSDSQLAWFGHHGLNAFILRPLLPFPKDRILATCRAHHLRYINDPTNLEPHITPRNAIRHCLADHPPFSRFVPLPSTGPLTFRQLNDAFLSFKSNAPEVDNEIHHLYAVVNDLAARAECVNHKVTSHLTQCILPSPIGTLLLSSNNLLDITDPSVRFALVLRVIRYVSFHPWGSLRADAGRRQSSINRIVRALWNPDPQATRIKRFTAGGGVLWTPAIFNPTKTLRIGNQCLHSPLGFRDRFCWLASRIPPFSKNPQQGAGTPTKLVIDLTERLAAATGAPTDSLEVLYDCRFLIRIRPLRIPTYITSALEKSDGMASIKVVPYTRYFWPKVIFQRSGYPDQVLAMPQESGTTTDPRSWISIHWVRPLNDT